MAEGAYQHHLGSGLFSHGKTLASGSADQTVRFWDTASGELRETIVPGESGYPRVVGNPLNR